MYKISIMKNDFIYLENVYLEFIYFKYIVVNIPNNYLDKRHIFHVTDTTFKIILDEEFSDFVIFLKKQNYNNALYPLCGCFLDIICIDCLFLDCIEPCYYNDEINKLKFKNKYLKFYKYSINYLTSKRNLFTRNYSQTIKNRLKSDKYIIILWELIQQNINEIDLNLFFYFYNNSKNNDLFLFNECIIEFLKKNKYFINIFFIKFGEMFDSLNFSSNFFKLLNDMFFLSDFRMREICISYNIYYKILNYKCKNIVEQLYVEKFINKIEKSNLNKYYK